MPRWLRGRGPGFIGDVDAQQHRDPSKSGLANLDAIIADRPSLQIVTPNGVVPGS